MYKRVFLGSLCFFLIVAPIAGNVDAASLEKEKVIITFPDDIDYKTLENYNITITEEFENIPSVAAEIPKYVARTMAFDSKIVSIEKDVLIKVTQEEVADYGIDLVHAPDAWEEDYTGKNVKIGVIDTGVDSEHVDLSIKDGISFVEETDGYKGYKDYHGHGTHVTGVINAQHNGLGVVGVAPDAEIYALKAFDATGTAYASTVIQAVEWGIEKKLDILNLSIGFQESSPALERIFKEAENKGILLVGAAGNDGTASKTIDNVDYPARYESVIAVGAIDGNENRAKFTEDGVTPEFWSSTGSAVEVVAPGQNVLSTYPDNKLAHMNGTSMATPYVTGVLALMKQAYPHASAKELRKMLDDTAYDLGTTGRDAEFGYGLAQFLMDSENTLEVSSLKATPSDASVTLSWKNPGHDFKEVHIYKNNTLLAKTASNTYQDKSLTPATTYTYHIATVDTAGNESEGISVTVKTDALYRTPKQVESVRATPTENSVKLTWKFPSDDQFKEVRVLRNGVVKFTSSSQSSFEEKNLKAGTTYNYQLVSVSPKGKESSPVNVEAKTKTSTNKTVTTPAKKLPFTDVKTNHWAYDDIQFVYNQKWMLGANSLKTFKPNQSLTRAEAAVILVRALGLEPKSTVKKASFKDVNTKHWAFKEVEIAKQHGIFTGTDKESFSPEQKMSRREIAAVLNRVTPKGQATNKKTSFKDVTKSDWAKDDITAMAGKNILSGYADGNFKPAQNVTRSEMASLMNRSHTFFKK